MIYLASPYSHPDDEVREQRYRAACRLTATLMKSGLLVFSPIAHSHGVAIYGEMELGWECWQKFDLEMIRMCDLLLIMPMTGWPESRGMMAELLEAKRLGMPIRYWDPVKGEILPAQTTGSDVVEFDPDYF